MIRLDTSPADLDRAAALLAEGKLVAFPTETVYGLGADASNRDAVAAIFRAKGRPPDHPVIVHLPDKSAMADWAVALPDAAWKLADAFWPGPLTLVVQRAPGVDPIITGGQDTVGLRVPGNPTALELLARFGGALAAPSANRFGRISPTRAEHVIEDFGDEVAAVVDGGACEVGVESTIVDVSGDRPLLLRPGMIPAREIGAVLGEEPEAAASGQGARASGRLASHYAPRTPMELVEADELIERAERLAGQGQRVSVLTRSLSDRLPDADRMRIERLPEEATDYARELYAALRRADAAAFERILVEMPPERPAWAAIRDRLRRAATRA